MADMYRLLTTTPSPFVMNFLKFSTLFRF